MDRTKALKAIADETRMKILCLLLKHNYCVRALAAELALSEAAVSQHLKVLREAGLLIGEKRGYFMHYKVARGALHELAGELEALAAMEAAPCKADMHTGCPASEKSQCHKKGTCGADVQAFCHGNHLNGEAGRGRHHD